MNVLVRRIRFCESLAILIAFLAFGPAQAAETVLYSFSGSSDGGNPLAGMIFDSQGALYGTTSSGGRSSCNPPVGCGTVFKLTPPAAGQTQWTEAVIYSFTGQQDGFSPEAGLIFDNQGALYGTTTFGGGASTRCSNNGCGTVFKLTPPPAGQTQWTETTLFSFAGGDDGGMPMAGVIFDSQGALYGTTYTGGGAGNCNDLGCGAVFKLTPPAAGQTQWTETVLRGFTGGPGDGGNPAAGLIFDAQGALYGTTTIGTTNSSCGMICPGWGTVFRLTPPAAGQTQWTETILYSFCPQKSCADGNMPSSGVIFDTHGALYGTTSSGGTSNEGVAFKLMPPAAGQTSWTENVIYSFAPQDGLSGVGPGGGLVFDTQGALYGTTVELGSLDAGTVFKLTPPGVGQTQWTQRVLYSFCLQNNCTDGEQPFAGVIFGPQGALLGTTRGGGGGGTANCSSACGAVFEILATLPDAHDFNGDGKSDIGWRDSNGDVAMWLMNGAAIVSSAGVGGASPSVWSVAGQRDFDGDGNADILWHDTSGNVAMWFMSAASIIGSAGVGNANPSVWSIAGTGDFNSDGKGDILWHDTSGNVAMWLMNGSSIAQSCGVGNANPGVWSIAGTGDFNGDGMTDILWHDDAGNVAIWFMNGCSILQSSGVGNANPAVWSIAGIGDFNGDGKSDILWHDTSGNVAMWMMNGAAILQSAGVGNANPSVWSIAETGDFNGDGRSDVLWHDTSGNVAVWEMNGASILQSAGIGNASASVWTIQGLHAD